MSDEKEKNVKIELPPFLALQILRLKPFVLCAIEEPLNSVSDLDKHTTYELFKAIEPQIVRTIRPDQIQDAKNEKEIKSMLYNPNPPRKNG